MPDDLLTYYERELSFLRQSGTAFAGKYPKIASRLLLEADQCADPHVERLLQGFALRAARVHRKMDDEFPEITDALLGILYPHYLAPIPSMAITQFVVDPEQGKLTSGHLLPRGTLLYSQPVGGTPCRFRTCYPVTLWPIEVTTTRLEAPDSLGPASAMAVLRLGLRCLGGTSFRELELDQLRVFLHGESPLVSALYELLFNHTCQVQLRPGAAQSGLAPVRLSPDCLHPVGFGPDEGLLPYSPRSFLGYRLLQEYFAFSWKFLFVDLCALDRGAQAGFQETMEIAIFLDRMPRLEQPLTSGTFRLGCTPIVNLFEQIAEPVRLQHTQSEYRIIPDVRRQESTEVYAIESVTCSAPHADRSPDIPPFYALHHAVAPDQQQAFWYAARRPSLRPGDAGTEVYLSLADGAFQPTLPATDTLTVHVTCSNRDLPEHLPFGGERGGFYPGSRRASGADSLPHQADRHRPASPATRRPVAFDLPSRPQLPVDL
jgi:type VI secretion system protein ImpG